MVNVFTEQSSARIPMYVIATPGSPRVEYFKKSNDLNHLFEITYIDAIMLDPLSLKDLPTGTVSADYANAYYGRVLRPGEFGCALSTNIARQLATSHPISLIVEDDARFINPFKTLEIVLDFIHREPERCRILSLYDGRLETGRLRKPSAENFTRIVGTSAGAVAYALTREAAFELLKANTPVKFLNDWPPTKASYFACNENQVTHGDFDSTIATDNYFRAGNPMRERLKFIFFIGYLKNLTLFGGPTQYIRDCYVPRIKNLLGNLMFRNVKK